MRSNNTIWIFFLLSASRAFAQGENDHWIFGDGAHISFKTGSPQIVNSSPEMNTLEGSTSVSDAEGRLLFYSDGNHVYNRDNQMMPHGDGLYGHKSSTSSAVAVPYPGRPKKFFLFCVDQNLSEDNKGLSYNLVDMELNYGMGDLSVKNRILKRHTDEKIAVTKQCNGRDYWVVIHKAFTDSFFTYSITQAGLNMEPVVSVIGMPGGERPEIGYLKFSPSGKFLVNAQTLAEQLDIYSFDKKTGRISAYASDTRQYHRSANKKAQTYYGVAFSARENFLYVSTLEAGEIFQYNLLLNPSQIFIKRYQVAQLKKEAGALQLGKDNKIYASDGYGSAVLHCITSPAQYGGACYFKAEAIFLPYGVHVNIGLPTLIETSMNYYNLGQDLVIQNPVNFMLDAKIFNGRYEWSTGETTQKIRISDTGGTYWVNVFDPLSCFFYTDTIRVLVYKKFLSDTPALQKLEFCSNTYTHIIPLRSKYPDVSFIWENDDPGIGLAKSGRGDIPAFFIPPLLKSQYVHIKAYPVKKGYVGQAFTVKLFIKAIPAIQESSMVDKAFCAGTRSVWWEPKAFVDGSQFKWYNSNIKTGLKDSGQGGLPEFVTSVTRQTEKSQITFYTMNNGCISIPYQMNLTVNPIPVMERLPDINICSGDVIPDISPVSDLQGTDYLIGNPFIPGQYVDMQTHALRYIRTPVINQYMQVQLLVLPVFKGCKGVADSFVFTLRPSPIANFNIHNESSDTAFFYSRVSIENRSKGYSAYTWSYMGINNSSDQVLELKVKNNAAWPVQLSVTNDFGCSSSSEKIINFSKTPSVYMPNAFSPNGDHHNDELTYSLFGITSHQLRIFNRWGECVFVSVDGKLRWNGVSGSFRQGDGVMTWVINAQDVMGNELDFKGTLTVIR
jgi:hypothetical protein